MDHEKILDALEECIKWDSLNYRDIGINRTRAAAILKVVELEAVKDHLWKNDGDTDWIIQELAAAKTAAGLED